jgi:hypothetical protein
MKDVGKEYDHTPKAREVPDPGQTKDVGKVPAQDWTEQLSKALAKSDKNRKG